MTMEKANSVPQKVSNTKDCIHKCVDVKPTFHVPCDVKPTFHVPCNTEKCPDTLMVICRHVEATLAQVTNRFKQDTTKIINKGNIATGFQLKMGRIHTLFAHLVHELGQHHLALFGALNPVKTSDNDKDTPSVTDNTIAIAGVHQLLKIFDLELLQCLDINCDRLMEAFEPSF